MLHSRDGVLFTIGLVDSSSNIAFMAVTIKFNFGLISPNDFSPGVLRLV